MSRSLVLALIATLFVALACGSESASPVEPAGDAGNAPDLEEPLTVFERLLALVPDTPDSRRMVRMNDIRAAQIAQGIALPGPDATPEEVEQYKIDVAFGPERPAVIITQIGDGWISGYQQDYISVAGGTKDSLGFDSRDIEGFVLLGEVNQSPQPIKEILIGEFSAIDAPVLLTACEECPPHRVVSYQGQDYFTWDDPQAQSLRNRELPPSFDYLGRAGHIVVADEYVFRTLDVPDLERLINTAAGSAGNLLSDEQYRAVARALAAGGAVSASLTDQSFDVETVIQALGGEELIESISDEPGMVDRIRAAVSGSGQLEPFRLLGLGLGLDEGGTFALVALAYDDSAGATKAAEQLADRMVIGSYPDFAGDGDPESFRDRVSDFEFTVEGAIVLGKFRTPSRDEFRDFTLYSQSSPDGNSYTFNRFGYLFAFD